MKFQYNHQEYSIGELTKLAKEKYGINIAYLTLRVRLVKYGWDVEKAISTPVNSEVKYDFKGTKYTITGLQELAKKLYHNNLESQNLRERLYRGWSVEKTISTPTRKRLETTNEQHIKERKKIATKKYLKANPDVARRIQALSYSRTFIRKYASLTELQKLSDQIRSMLGMKASSNVVEETQTVDLSPEDRRKKTVAKSQMKAYFNSYATTQGLEELLQLTEKRINELNKQQAEPAMA